MNTSLIAVLICFGLCLKIALTIGAIHYFRLPSSKYARKRKRKGGQRVAKAREKKAVSRTAPEISTTPVIKEPAVSSAAKPLKPVPVANEQQPQGKAAGTASATTETKRVEKPRQEPPAGKTPPEGERKTMKVVTGPPRKQGEKINVVDIRKKGQPNITPTQTPSPAGPSKDAAVSRTAVTGATEPKSVGKPPQEPAATGTSAGEIDKVSGAAEPDVTTVKEDEAGMSTEPGAGDNQESSGPPAEDTDAEETEQDKGQKDKSGLGDLADLFATNASDFTEKSKLSEQVQEVDVNDILQEGLGLLGKVKKPDK